MVVLALGLSACDQTRGVLQGPGNQRLGGVAGVGAKEGTTLASSVGCDELLASLKAEAGRRLAPGGIVYRGNVTNRVIKTHSFGETVPSYGIRNRNAIDGEPKAVQVGDGRRLVTLRNGQLALFRRSASGRWTMTGSYDGVRGDDLRMFLSGDRVFVVTVAWHDEAPFYPAYQRTEIYEIDISDPSEMQVVESLSIDGFYVSSHLIDGVIRLAVEHVPSEVSFTGAEFPDGAFVDLLASPSEIERRNLERLESHRQMISESTIDTWLPTFRWERGGRTTTGQLTPCDQVYVPSDFSGFSTLSVLAIDPAVGLEPTTNVSVLAEGVAALSPKGAYLATNIWDPPPPDGESDSSEAIPGGEVRTDLHKFAVGAGSRSSYEASGVVAGHLHGTVPISEHVGVLRVGMADGVVRAFQHWGDALTEVGSVSEVVGSEALASVRFDGERGYAVSAQSGLLASVIDLSDPTAPTIEGQHPDGLLLGEGDQLVQIRQIDMDWPDYQGSIEVSVFDVTDPTLPLVRAAQRLADITRSDWWATPTMVRSGDGAVSLIGFEGSQPPTVVAIGASPTNGPPSATTVAPIAAAPPPPPSIVVPDNETTTTTAGSAQYVYEQDDYRMLVIRASPTSITANEVVRQPDGSRIRHWAIHDDQLVTVSYSGVAMFRLADLAPHGWFPHTQY